MCLSVHRCICVEKKNQLDVTEWFFSLTRWFRYDRDCNRLVYTQIVPVIFELPCIICSTCFGHFYAHHQELETICVLLPPMVCSAWLLVFGGQVQSSRQCIQEEGCCVTAVVYGSWISNPCC